MAEPLWPVMTREQWARLCEAVGLVSDTMRAHLGTSAVSVQLLALAFHVVFEDLERHIEQRAPKPVPVEAFDLPAGVEDFRE